MARHHVYAGCYTGYEPGQLGWVGSTQPGEGITRFSFDTEDGTLTPTGEVTRQDSPSWLEVSPDGRFLVAPHDMTPTLGVPEGVGFVTAYRIGANGSLEAVSTARTGGHGNTCVAFDRTGRFLLLTRYWDGGITVVPFDPETGAIGEITAAPNHDGHGPNPLRQATPHPHGIQGDPRTDLVYVADLGTDRVHQYRLDTATGALEPHDEVRLAEGSGPRGMTFHPALRVAYVNCELDGTVVVCDIDDERGLLPVQTLRCYSEGFSGRGHPQNHGKSDLWGAEGCLSADGGLYFYICRVEQSIAVFRVSPEDGRLSPINRASLVDHSNARNLALAPGGNHLLVASQDADCIEVLRIDHRSGTLERVGTQPAPCPTDVAVI